MTTTSMMKRNNNNNNDNNNNKVVCVTGANGFIGSWVVRRLLEKGYTVHATVYPSSSPDAYTHLLSLPGASAERVLVFPAHLLDAGALSEAIRGCSGVFHVASPCSLEDPTDPQRDLVEPAVQGTLNVLEASKESGSVKRVVLTSSISAMVPNPAWPNYSRPLDESSWTDLDYCYSRNKWYPVSKTLAEKAARDFAQKHDMDVVSINPSTCLGPLLQPVLNASSAVLQQLLLGSQDSQHYHWLGAVHVRDVANAQVLLFETPQANGRYLCTNGIYQFRDFALTVSNLYPQFPVHRFTEETQPGMMACKDAAKRLIDLGLVFTPIEEAIRDSVESLKAKGVRLLLIHTVALQEKNLFFMSISEESLRRYVHFASESCIQELLSASDSNKAGNGDGEDGGWKVLALEDGVEISKRRSGSLHVFRSRWVLKSVSPQQFITVANAIDAAKQWDSELVEAKYIKDLEENLSIIRLRFGDASKPLFKNREFIVYERRETMDDGTLVVAVASLPKVIAAGLQPKRSNSIRGLLLQSGWVVENLEDNSCMVTYVVQLDPAGWLPKFFVNRRNTKLVMIIDNLKKLAQACPNTL
ncbi:hypothetical protein Sjap_021241 [Stephania japonica]|uniref:START domain-containing protein n=1 Tax=Stephania japonica TaxID=461633 RepID=A0AAP0HRB8_9MAGN